MDGWMDGWIGGWVDGWMDGWMDGWQSSVLINLMQMEIFFFIKKRISLVSTAIAMNRLTFY